MNNPPVREQIVRMAVAIAVVVAGFIATPLQAQEAYEKALHRRAVEAAIWGMPAVSMRSAINATKRDLGGAWNDVVYFSKPMVSRHGFLTANNQTPYVISSINTKDGPMVVDVPAASKTTKFFGSFIDAWQLTQLWPLMLMAVVMALLVVVRHKTNIKRLLDGSETKTGQKD